MCALMAVIPDRWYVHMETVSRLGALDIDEAITARIGSYVDVDFMQFIAADGDRVAYELRR